MARRSDHSREELEKLAVDAGYALLAEEGLAGFSARQVAARIGYTIGTIYNVFGSYDTFLHHVHARTLDAWHDFLQEALARRGNRDALQTLALAYVEFARTNYNLWVALFEQRREDGAPLPDWYEAKLRRLVQVAETILLPYVDHNTTKAKRATQVLWAGIHGLCVLSLSGKLKLIKADSLNALVQALVENYLRGERESKPDK
jgi:AcrR family transcriptional regulator